MYRILLFLILFLFHSSDSIGFQKGPLILSGREEDTEELLVQIANDTWGYFRDFVDGKTGLPPDNVRILPEMEIGRYTSPTNIGMYILSVISAHDMGFIAKEEAIGRINKTLNTVRAMEKYDGWLYNWYDFDPLRHSVDFISVLDCAWFTMALVITRQTYPEMYDLCSEMIDLQDFSFFYDEGVGHLRHGYGVGGGGYSPYHYGLLCTESRIASYVAIGKGDVSGEHYFRMERVLADSGIEGSFKTYHGASVFEGYLKYKDIKIVPSWGGSLFEFLSPALFVDEENYANGSLGINDSLAAFVHLDYCLNEKGYPVWGMSPCCAPDYKYREYGVSLIGEKDDGYPDGIVTPYASIIAIEFLPEAVIENIKNLLSYDIYGDYGFYDSVDPFTGEVARIYLCLDQALILISLNNYLNDGIIRKRFHKDKIGIPIEELLSVEEFF